MGEFSDGAMLALYPAPDVVDALALPDGLDPAELHVTIAYLGHADDVDQDAALAIGRRLARRAPITGSFNAHARFAGGKKGDVIVALLDSPDIEALRRDTVAALEGASITVPGEHGYVPHLSRAYIDPDEPSPVERVEPIAAEFGALSVVHGNVRTDIPFAAEPEPEPVEAIAAYARHAFAAGWARSGGPMTERVKAASQVAVRMACDHADDPHILELALDLGSLEGMWALLFSRRAALITARTATVGAAWADLLSRDNLGDAVDRFGRELRLLGESDDSGADDAGEDDDRREARIRAAATAAAAAMLTALAADPAWEPLRTAVRDALAAGRAEGEVAAVAVAAERAGRIGLDWDIAFDDAYQAMANLQDLWPAADDWLTRTLGRATDDLGKALSDSMLAGGDYDDMIDAASAAIGGVDADAVAFITDWAITTAADQGALALYRREGATSVSWLSAGDGRVCPTCEGNETNSPYDPGDVPTAPAHPRCRCVLAADISLDSFGPWFTTT